MDNQSENQYKEGEHFKRTRPQTFDPLNKDSKKTRRVGVSDTSTEVETTVCVIETLTLMMIECVVTLFNHMCQYPYISCLSPILIIHPPLDVPLSLTNVDTDP